MAKSTYLSEESSNQRPLQIRWNLAFEIDLTIIKTRCPNGYDAFTRYLMVAAKAVVDAITEI